MPRYTCSRGGGAGGGIQRTARCDKGYRVTTGAPRDALAWAKRHARFCNHYKTIFDVIRVELEQPPVYGHSRPRSNYGWHDTHRPDIDPPVLLQERDNTAQASRATVQEPPTANEDSQSSQGSKILPIWELRRRLL